MIQNTKLYTALALAGTLPFIAAALLPLFGYEALPRIGSLDAMVASYGLAIVCFLAGAHWGTCLMGRSVESMNLFVISNVIFLATWFAYIGASLNVALGMQIITFVSLLFIDYRLRGAEVISSPYFRIRTIATTIAVISLLVVIILGTASGN